ncbi:hypothetical protein F5Y19DRAFT_116158 [Xylariaceae sp. FL1651]|nr:hypothetical protein F5Y19DRAFT_116158 [Xylariaceae sp. FL1651]
MNLDLPFLMRFCNSALTPLVLRPCVAHICCSCLFSSVETVRSSWRISLFEEAMVPACCRCYRCGDGCRRWQSPWATGPGRCRRSAMLPPASASWRRPGLAPAAASSGANASLAGGLSYFIPIST